ncbi:10275_t:CDS:2 [Paraglomus brasilianum]|uniref:10275_t:CDS:1 n=1 Tax=Paraglomus brasilianum TaxID=144538 RepID=A0A9N8WB14_9GLOM|nr:10275_t:CDS:2 [Paraglomus brasilianum]
MGERRTSWEGDSDSEPDLFDRYETFKIVKVQDQRLGILYRLFQLGIFVYILYTIIADEGYLRKEPPVNGAVRISLQAPSTLSAPPYCNNPLPCIYWGANEIQFPSDGAGVAFVTTRASVKRYPPPTGCNFLSPSSPTDPCIFDAKTTPFDFIANKSYIGDIENYTLMIEHSIRGQTTSIAVRNGIMDGKLMSADGKTVIKEWTNATRMAENSEADGDIVTVSDLLQAAGANLEAPSTAPGAAPGETYRSSGIVIVIVIEYTNVPFKKDELSYKYLPQVIDGNEYKTVENLYQSDGSYILKDRHGIRFVFQQHGQIGEFNMIALLQNIVAGFALFGLAAIIVEFLMLKLLPEKQLYEEAKFEATDDIDQMRKNKSHKLDDDEESK